MPENWRSYPIRELAANASQSFTDGDWIEAPHIRETGIRLIQTGNIGIGSFIDRWTGRFGAPVPDWTADLGIDRTAAVSVLNDDERKGFAAGAIAFAALTPQFLLR